MYQVKPKGLNVRQNDRDVADGFLQESINLQWRDGAYRPIPNRLVYVLSNYSSLTDELILHKVSDEDQINVLALVQGDLVWLGTIIDGVYTANTQIIELSLYTQIDGLSFTILNGLVYLMSSTDEFYYRLQYNETEDTYELKDMYAWKSLLAFNPNPGVYFATYLKGSDTYNLLTQCGVILYRFTLVLNTGEEVLHSPIYANYIYGVNRSSAVIKKDDLITNIHTLINTNLEFADTSLFNSEISAINFYASIPYYETKIAKSSGTFGVLDTQDIVGTEVAKSEIQRLSELPFYLIKTLDNVSADKNTGCLLITIGDFDLDISFTGVTDESKISGLTIASGQVMPVDNFTAHKLYGELTSNNGRIVVNKPKTVLSNGHIRSLAFNVQNSKVGFRIDTEDGSINGEVFQIDRSIIYDDSTGTDTYRGLLSYPDSRAKYTGASGEPIGLSTRMYKLRSNKAVNLACAFDFYSTSFSTMNITDVAGTITIDLQYAMSINYRNADVILASSTPIISDVSYVSTNRLQFSESGEFSVWPAINSYRVGSGKIQFVGNNSVDPSNTDYISPLLIGTSDGIYTVNFDTTGVTLIQSITKAANMPAISSENIQIDQSLVYVSDKGLIAINSGQINNLTKDYFPEQGNAYLVDPEIIYPNYDLLFDDSNVYILGDIVDYMKGAVFAYDGRRNNLWCSNFSENYSLVYNLITKQWDMSTFIFKKAIDLFGILSTSEGDIYSRYLVQNNSGTISILSGEDLSTEVDTHLSTRPIKIQSTDEYKKIERVISRCELYRGTASGYFSFGLWGKQDLNKNKVNIPLIAYRDNTSDKWPNNIRQDIPIGRQKGKYKTITISQTGRLLPESSIDSFDIVAKLVDNKIMR